MSLSRINYHPRMIRYLVDSGSYFLKEYPFILVDVGASGGIEPHWNSFGNFLNAYGFEPLIAECEKLNEKENSNCTYFPYFVGADHDLVSSIIKKNLKKAGKLYQRSSSAHFLRQKKINYIKESFNSGNSIKYSDKTTTLDTFFFETHPVLDIDFIKIDTDGHDYAVLHGAKRVLHEKQVLGLSVEVQMHGLLHEHANIFRNIDRFLSEAGFSLFDLDVYRYTKKDLPGQFCYVIPAQTKTGQVTFGEALYLRDYAAAKKYEINRVVLSPAKIMKLACIQELFGMPDASAELINRYKKKLRDKIDVEYCLDLLAQDIGIADTFAQHNGLFQNEPHHFFPVIPEPAVTHNDPPPNGKEEELG